MSRITLRAGEPCHIATYSTFKSGEIDAVGRRYVAVAWDDGSHMVLSHHQAGLSLRPGRIVQHPGECMADVIAREARNR